MIRHLFAALVAAEYEIGLAHRGVAELELDAPLEQHADGRLEGGRERSFRAPPDDPGEHHTAALLIGDLNYAGAAFLRISHLHLRAVDGPGVLLDPFGALRRAGILGCRRGRRHGSRNTSGRAGSREIPFCR